MPTNVRDPRTVITPHAFGISPDLLGTPLARPWSRFWALAIDLAVVGLLTLMLRGFWMFVWGVVALFLVWIAFQRSPGGESQAVSMLLRISAGCLGAIVLSAVVLVGLFLGLARDEGEEGPSGPDIEGVETGRSGLLRALEVAGTVVPGIAGAGPLARAETADEAEEAALELMESLDVPELDRRDRMDLLEEMTPSEAPWADQADRIYRRALDRWEDRRSAGGVAGGEVAEEPIPGDVTEEVAALGDDQVLEAWAALLRRSAGDSTVMSSPRARALRHRAVGIVASDTVSALAAEVRDLRDALEEQVSRRRAAERAVEEKGNAFVALLRDVWEQLGSAIGLWSIYFTLVTTVFAGQTVGKRLLGIRVLRLDGTPITAWAAFERAGGYVAGLATGLLGFAQVFWDPNRQCVHDKIVGTVVVDDRAEKVPGAWEETWAASPGDASATVSGEAEPEGGVER